MGSAPYLGPQRSARTDRCVPRTVPSWLAGWPLRGHTCQHAVLGSTGKLYLTIHTQYTVQPLPLATLAVSA